MKKLFILLLAVAAMIMLSCPSDPEPPPPSIEDFDFVMTGGDTFHRVEIPVEGVGGFVITHDQEYRVTFTIQNADEDFFPSRMGAKLVYRNEGDTSDTLLAGWQEPTPSLISGPGAYRWTFKAGEKYKDGMTPGTPATTPVGAKQYFIVQVQKSGYGQYESYYEFRVKGDIKVEGPPTGILTKTSDIAMVFTGSDHNEAIGKGNIEGAEFEKIKAAAGNGAFLRFYITDVEVSALAAEEGHSVGSVGNRSNVSGDINPNPQFYIPIGTSAGTNVSFTADVDVAAALDFVGDGESHIFVNMWGEGPAKCSKVELWEYK